MKAPALGHGAQARQGLQPALGTLRVGQAQADPALAAVRRKLAVELRRGAGQLGLQPALQRGGSRVDAQLLAQQEKIEAVFGVRPIVLQNDCLEISSTEARRLLFFGIADEVLHPDVLAYVPQLVGEVTPRRLRDLQRQCMEVGI